MCNDEFHESRSDSDNVSLNVRHVRRTLLAIVVVNFLINARNVARNWDTLTFLHCFIGTTIWGVLPIVAVILIFRRRMLGHWILVVLFGCRGVAVWLYLAWIAYTCPSSLGSQLYLFNILDAAFYLGAAIWVFVSIGHRGRMSHDNPNTPP